MRRILKLHAAHACSAVSDNYRFYFEKTRKHRANRDSNQALRDQLESLLAVVRRCEAMWALEDRIERGFGPGGL